MANEIGGTAAVAQLASIFGLPDAVARLLDEVRELRALVESSSPDLLNVAQAASFLCMSPEAVRKAAARGTIPCQRIGRRLRFSRRELLKRKR